MGLKKATVKLGADIGEFTSKMRKASSSFKKMGKNIQKAGKTMSMSLTAPLTAFAAASVKAFDTQAKAEAKLSRSLNGNVKAFRRLKKEAQALQKVTLFGDEETMAAQAMLTSMGLEEEAVRRLTPLIQDMATTKNMDLRAAADLVAKSVGSSTNALSRYGITIEGAVGSTERLDSAVGSLSTMFSGQATSAAEAGAGAWVQLKNAMMDFAEEVGGALMPMLDPLKDKLEEVTKKLGNLSTAQITGKIKSALFVGAIGPVILVLSKLAGAIRVLTAHPILLILTGITALALKLRNDFTPAVTRAFLEERRLYKLRAKYGKDLASGKRTATGALDVGFMAGTGKANVQDEIKKTAEAIDTLKEALGKYVDMPLAEVPMRGFDGVNYKKLRKNLYDTEADLRNLEFALKRITDAEAEADREADKLNKTLKTQEDNATNLAIAEYQLQIQLAAVRAEHSALSDSILNKTNVLKDITTKFVSSFADGFVNLFGKVEDLEGNIMSFGQKFENFAKSLIGDLVKMIAKAVIFAAIMTAITGGSFAAGGVATSGGTNFQSHLAKGLTGMATGGNVLSGQPYLVGEHGPELFTPSGSSGGRISSASQTAQMGIPDVRISGEDLIIVFDRARKHRNTLG